MTKRNRATKQPKGRMSVRLDSDILGPMQTWADENGLPLSWVVSRILKLGWPIFMRQDAPKLETEESIRATA